MSLPGGGPPLSPLVPLATVPVHVPADDGSPAGTVALRGTFLATGLWCAALAPFISVMLQERGLDALAIGTVSALAAAATAVVIPAWGHLGDAVIGRARAFQVGLVVATGGVLASLLPLGVPLVAILLASSVVFVGLFLGLGDALAMGALRVPQRQYGALRALTSLSFAVGVIAAGLLYDVTGYGAAVFVAVGTSIVLFALVTFVPDPTRHRAVRERALVHDKATADSRFGSVGRVFAVQPRLLGVLVVLTIVYAGLQGAGTFVPLRIAELGGAPSDVALSAGIGAFLEIPGLIVAGLAGRRLGLRPVFIVAAVVYAACVISWGVLPTPVAINATRIATGLCYGVLATARVVIVARLLPASLQATGQGLVQAVTVGLGTVLGDVLGGLQYGTMGPTAFFATAGIVAIVGAIGGWFALRGDVGASDRALLEAAPA